MAANQPMHSSRWRMIATCLLLLLATQYQTGCSGCSGGSAGGSNGGGEVADGADDTGDAENHQGIPTPAYSFSKSAPTLIESGAVFPGIVYDGDQIIISYAKENHLFIRPFDASVTPTGEAIQVSRDGEEGLGVTDHKHLFFQNHHYLLYSTIGDRDLYLIKLDRELNRVGFTVAVAQDSQTTATNDMILGTDGLHIITGEFRPPDKNNGEKSGHLIKRYTTDLISVGSEIVANPFSHSNTASMVLADGVINFVAPETPNPSGRVQTERNLILIRYTTDWETIDEAPIILVDSSSLTHSVAGDGIWMSTGAAYDESSNLLFVGHTFSHGSSGSDTGDIYFRVFDESYREIHSELMVASDGANRVHFLLKEGTLFALYDERSSGPPSIYCIRYTLSK